METEDVRIQNDNLRTLNEDLKKENETIYGQKLELDEKISALEQVKIESQRLVTKLKN